MSSLWTPGGEHEVPRPSAASSDFQASASPAPQPSDEFDDYGQDQLTPEEEHELREMQAQMLSVPASSVISNHVVNIFNLAMLHLFSSPPNLAEAALSIDAATAIVEKLEGRLGHDEPTLVDAVHQMRLAFVQVRNTSAEADAD
jgi:hypothetical protein